MSISSRIQRVTLTFSLALIFLSGPGSAQVRRNRRVTEPPPARPAEPSMLRMRYDAGYVTGEFRSSPLQNVLEELAARTGTVFELPYGLNPPVSMALFKVGLTDAIKRILRDTDYLIYYGSDPAGGNKPEFVRIFQKAAEGQAVSLRYIGTGVPTKTSDDYVETPEQALQVLISSPKAELRAQAVEVLASTRGEVAVEALISTLKDAAPEVRAAAVDGLAAMGATVALPGLVQALRDVHPAVRQSAVEAVALLGDSLNLSDLRPLLKDPDGSVASAAEMAVRRLSTRRP